MQNENKIKHPVIRYHGGKFRLAAWVIAHMPAHTCYTEPSAALQAC